MLTLEQNGIITPVNELSVPFRISFPLDTRIPAIQEMLEYVHVSELVTE